MDDYIKRENAIDAAIQGAEEYDCGYGASRDDLIMEEINRIPAADVVEVVRCKDCASYSVPSNNLGRDGICFSLNQYCPGWFFCANGRRKTR